MLGLRQQLSVGFFFLLIFASVVLDWIFLGLVPRLQAPRRLAVLALCIKTQLWLLSIHQAWQLEAGKLETICPPPHFQGDLLIPVALEVRGDCFPIRDSPSVKAERHGLITIRSLSG